MEILKLQQFREKVKKWLAISILRQCNDQDLAEADIHKCSTE